MYFIWSLINASFIILFFALVLALFTKGKKLFNDKFGSPIIVILVVGVLGILNPKDIEHNNTYMFSYDKEVLTNISKSNTIKLEDNLTCSLIASIRLKQNNKGKFVPIFIRTMYNGLIGGFQWEQMGSTINENKEGTFSYDIHGVTHWSLFGFKVYTQSKNFKGSFELEEY